MLMRILVTLLALATLSGCVSYGGSAVYRGQIESAVHLNDHRGGAHEASASLADPTASLVRFEDDVASL